MREKRKVRKGKVILVGIAIVIIIAVIAAIIINVINKNNKSESKKPEETTSKETVVYDLPDITYSEMQVTNIEMEYLEDNNETMVSMIINNTTENAVENESLTAYLIDGNGETVGQTKTFISSLAPGGQYSITVILKGNLTSTAQIKLQK